MKMKTTLNSDDSVMTRLKREAANRGCPMSELVETVLRLLLQSKNTRDASAKLPAFKSGGHLVDISDRDALCQAMEGH